MKEKQLAISDLEFILKSLTDTRHKFEDYQDYPSYEFKQERLAEVENVIAKIRAMKDALRTT